MVQVGSHLEDVLPSHRNPPARTATLQSSTVTIGCDMDSPRWSDVYLTAAARGVSVCGDLLAATALTVVLQQRGAGGYVVAALLLSASLPPVLLSRLTGRVADRFDSRVVIAVVAPVQ